MGIKAEAVTHKRSDHNPGAPTGRQYAYGLAFVGVVLGVLVGTPAWLVVASDACGCITPVDVTLYNADSHAVTVSWRQPGIFGTPILAPSGMREIAACTSTDVILPVGRDTVTITSVSGSSDLAVEVPPGHGGYAIPMVVVRAGGAIEQLDVPLPDAEVPMDGRCGS